jgi:hypothetical protein
MPRKIRILLQEYRTAGGIIRTSAGKGSHRKILHPKFPGLVVLSGSPGEDAKPYQERDLKHFKQVINEHQG